MSIELFKFPIRCSLLSSIQKDTLNTIMEELYLFSRLVCQTSKWHAACPFAVQTTKGINSDPLLCGWSNSSFMVIKSNQEKTLKYFLPTNTYNPTHPSNKHLWWNTYFQQYQRSNSLFQQTLIIKKLPLTNTNNQTTPSNKHQLFSSDDTNKQHLILLTYLS